MSHSKLVSLKMSALSLDSTNTLAYYEICPFIVHHVSVIFYSTGPRKKLLTPVINKLECFSSLPVTFHRGLTFADKAEIRCPTKVGSSLIRLGCK